MVKTFETINGKEILTTNKKKGTATVRYKGSHTGKIVATSLTSEEIEMLHESTSYSELYKMMNNLGACYQR